MIDMGAPFEAKYGGTCGICGLTVEKGETAHYVGPYGSGVFAHEHCWLTEGPIGDEGDGVGGGKYVGERGNGAAYRVRGARNHEKRCSTCFLTHAGECP